MTDALVVAAKVGDLARVRELLDGGTLDGAPATEALVGAIIHGHLEVVRALLDHGADPDHRLAFDQTPLFYATSKGVAMVDLLLRRGADPNARSSIGFDALHRYLADVGPGVRLGSADVGVVNRLIEAGLDVRARNADLPHVPLACAAASVPVLEALFAAGADPNAKAPRTSVLWEAIKSSNRAGVFAALVRGGIDANTRCTNAAVDTTILAEVCALGDLESARTLLDRGADPNAGGRNTPLARAEECDNPALIDLLLERGARPLLPPLSAEATHALDVAEHDAKAHPDDPGARLGWAQALLQHGFRAAAASEVAALRRRGAEVPAELVEALAFEAPAGVRWTFVDFQPSHDGVAPRTSDTRFPGARVTDGRRTVPFVLTKGSACTACDERGEVLCSSCKGSGWSSTIFDDDPVECAPRQRCPACRGLSFVVTGERLGKGSCPHPRVEEEMKVGDFSFRRCRACGLAALHGPDPFGGLRATTDFACGVCGRFACSCDFARRSRG